MLNIDKHVEGGEATIVLAGRLDTSTSPQLESTVRETLPGVTSLVLDLADLEYVSSAGLRVILSAQKTMIRQGSMKLINVGDSVMEVFEVTGFTEILDIQ